MKSNKILYMGLLLLVTFLWGITFPITKIVLQFLSPVIFLSFRFFVSVLIMIPFLIKKKNVLSRTNIKYGFSAGTLLFIGYYFQTIGLDFTTPSKSGIITGMYVVLIPLISYFYLKKKVSRFDILASFMAFGGLMVMSAGAVSNSSVQLGDLLTFICAVGYALQIAYVSKYSKDLDSTVFTFYQILTVSILSTIAIPTYFPILIVINPFVIFTLLFTAIFGGIFAYYVSTRALIFVEPTTAGIIFVGEPIFAAIFSVIINGDVLGTLTIIGGSIMVLAMFVTSFDKYLTEKKSRQTAAEYQERL